VRATIGSAVLSTGLVLGQSETNVLEMTGAYGAIANGGVWNRPHLIGRILDSSDCRDRNDLKTLPHHLLNNDTQCVGTATAGAM